MVKLGDLPVGTIVQHKDTKYLGVPIQWEVVARNHVGYPTNSVTLQTKQIITAKAMDAQEPKNSNSGRREYGNNNTTVANLPQWLNSNQKNWYAAQHGADQAPDSKSVVTYNPYASEAGFLTNFAKQFVDAILPTTLTTVIPDTDGGGVTTEVRKVFLPSRTEVGLGDERSGSPEGSKWERYTNDTSRKKTRTAEAISQAESSYDYWWLRTPYSSSADYVRHVNSDGALNIYYARSGNYGLAPALNLPSTLSVSKVGDVYEVEFNAAPTVTLNTQDNQTFYEGSTLNINGTVNDSDVGDVMIVKYRIAGERDRVILTQVSTGNPVDYGKVLTFTKSRFYDGDTAVTNALVEGQTYTLEVFAQDDKGNTSAVQTRKFKVVPNRPPLIEITETPELEGGVASSDLSIKGNVNDPDGDEVRLSYKLNDGREVPIVVSDDEFGITLKVTDLKNGRNIVVIIARDEYEAMTTRQVEINLSSTSSDTDHIKSKMYYKIDTKGVETDGVLLWLRRPLGDETNYKASLSIVDKEASESYVKMDKSTAIVQEHNRDEFIGNVDTKASDVRIKLEFDGESAPIEMVQGVIK